MAFPYDSPATAPTPKLRFPKKVSGKVKLAPVVAAPQRPPLSPQQFAARARAQALAQLAPQEQTILGQQQAAEQQAASDQAALAGINKAAASSIAGIAPTITGAYRGAAQEQGQLAQGFSDVTRDRVQQANDQAARQAAGYGIAPNPGTDLGPDANALHDTIYALGGYIPGSDLAAQAAAAAQYGAGITAANASTGRIATQERQAQLAQDEAGYASDLEKLVAQYPSLYDKALSALQTYDLNLRKEQQAEQNAANLEDYRTKSLGERVSHDRATEGISKAALGISEGNLKLSDKRYRLDVEKAAQAGRQLDRNLSLALGYAVDKLGEPILSSTGKHIPVSASSFSVASSTKTPQARYSAALKYARTLRGSPVRNPSQYGGAYFAAPGASGTDVTPPLGKQPATTSNPQKAQYGTTMTFVEAQTFLMQEYDLPKSKARSALIAAGWKPDGIRPNLFDSVAG